MFTERKKLIAGSIGPYGASLCDLSEYSGSYAKNLTIEVLTLNSLRCLTVN